VAEGCSEHVRATENSRAGQLGSKNTRATVTEGKTVSAYRLERVDMKPKDLRSFAQRILRAVEEADPSDLLTPREAGLDDTPMPAGMLALVSEVLGKLANGQLPSVMVLDDNDEMTTEQAAAVLGVSRPHLIQLLATQDVPHRRLGDSPGAHRRIPREEVLALKQRRERSGENMDELMRLSEELAD